MKAKVLPALKTSATNISPVSTGVGEHQSQQAQLASALRIAVMRLSRRLRNETTDEKLTLTQLVRGGKKTVKTIVVT